MKARAVAMVCALVYTYTELTPILQEHLEDNEGEILPHLLMADITRNVSQRIDHWDFCKSFMSWLEQAWNNGTEYERDVIGASAVEMIPDPGQPGSELRTLLGKSLRTLDPWAQ